MEKLLRAGSVVGMITLILTGIITEILSKLGRMAYTIAEKGVYNPLDYAADFTAINIIAACMLALGIIFTFVRSLPKKQ